MPPNTEIIDRRTAWGNPFKVGDNLDNLALEAELSAAELSANVITLDISLRLFRAYLCGHRNLVEAARHYLAGKNLACWCKLDAPCHGDVWIEILNPENKQYSDHEKK